MASRRGSGVERRQGVYTKGYRTESGNNLVAL